MKPGAFPTSRASLEIATALIISAAMGANASAEAAVHVYGPGGPAPAMKRAAERYSAAHGGSVIVTAGPASQWAEQVKGNADILFSDAENMMSSFANALPNAYDLQDAEQLYLRPAAILARPGNPKEIQGFKDLLKQDMTVFAVAGAGQTDLWEEMVRRLDDTEFVTAFRSKLVLPETYNCAAARQQWTDDTSNDTWLICGIWQASNPELAEQVCIGEPYRIHRDACGILTFKGKPDATAGGVVDYLKPKDEQSTIREMGLGHISRKGMNLTDYSRQPTLAALEVSTLRGPGR